MSFSFQVSGHAGEGIAVVSDLLYNARDMNLNLTISDDWAPAVNLPKDER